VVFLLVCRSKLRSAAVINVTVKFDDGDRNFNVDAGRVAELLDVLRHEDSRLSDYLVKGINGSHQIIVSLNGDDVRFGRYLNTPLKDGDNIQVEIRSRDKDRIFKELYLTFSGEALGQPLLYTVGSMFSVVVNIRGASITARRGFAHIELEGPRQEVDAVLEWFRRKNVQVESLDGNEKQS